MRFLRFLAAVFALGLAVPAASAESFDKAQQDEIRSLVKSYLLEHPEVIADAMTAYTAKEERTAAEATKSAIAQAANRLYHSPADLVAGNPKAKIALVEFFDYNCGYCKQAMPDVMKLISSDPEVRVIFKELPVLGEGSVYASRAALAARQQNKYWEFHQALLGHKGRLDEAAVLAVARDTGLDTDRLVKDMTAADVDVILVANKKLADDLGINGTPAFISGATLVPGAIGFDGLSAFVSAVRAENACAKC